MFNYEITDECKEPVLEMLSIRILSTWVKHQVVNVNIQGLS